MQADQYVAVCHRLHTAHAGENGHRSEFALAVSQQVALEKVSEQMLFQKAFDSRGEYGISCFRSIRRHTRYFGKYVASAFVTTAVVFGYRRFPTDGIVDAASFALVHYLHEGLNGPQAARKSAVGVGVNQHFVHLVDGHTDLQSLRECLFQMFQIAFARIGCHCDNGLLTGGQCFVRFGIATFGRGFAVLFVAYGIEPVGCIRLRIALDSHMGEPAVGSGSVPVHYVGCDFDDIARKQPAGRLSFLLIVTDTCRSDQNLSAFVRMPAVAAAGLESNVEHRDIQFPVSAQRCEPHFAREMGIRGYFLAQRIGLAESFRRLRVSSYA